MHDDERSKPVLLCLAQSFSPDTTPTAIRASQLLAKLSERWSVVVLTESEPEQAEQRVRVEVVRSRRPRKLLTALRRMRLSKLLELFVWPDESIFWVIPAVLAGRRAIRELAPSAIVVFMMPYSSGLAGIALRRLSGLPLILNLDDSPTCTDMHPSFPTRFHFRLARALEDYYARRADAIVYVSARNLEAVRARQPKDVQPRFHLVRYGADLDEVATPPPAKPGFEIAYVGAMSGWWALIERGSRAGRLHRAYDAWSRLGRFERTALDQQTSSPAVIGAAIHQAVVGHPEWTGKVRLTVHGNPYPPELVAQALAAYGIDDVVAVTGPVPHDEVAAIIAAADLLFLTLPRRIDGSPGGRISAKTYEYLATDRPILAAVPHGENWDYLEDKPGVWLVEPDDRTRMGEIVAELASAKFAGAPRSFDRSQLRPQLSYAALATQFEAAVRAGIEHASTRGRARDGT